jgi:hypothetical protein
MKFPRNLNGGVGVDGIKKPTEYPHRHHFLMMQMSINQLKQDHAITKLRTKKNK